MQLDVSFLYRKIYLQLCTGGDLFSFITYHTDTHRHMHPSEARFIMYQILQALDYLHGREICHRGTSRSPCAACAVRLPSEK